MKKSTPQQAKKASNFRAEEYLDRGIKLEEINEIKQAFDLFDTDLGGSIDTKCTRNSYIQSLKQL